MKSILFTAAISGILLAGCCHKPDNEALLAELRNMSEKMEAFSEQLAENTRAVEKVQIRTMPARETRRVSYEALEKIKLPRNPSDADIVKYLREIQKVTANQTVFSWNDPQTAMLQDIGPGHLKILLPFLQQPGMASSYFRKALPSLVGPADKAVALENLKKLPMLTEAILENGWLEDVRDQLWEILEGNGRSSFDVTQNAAKLIRNDADRKRLIEIYTTHPQRVQLFSVISDFPGIDLKAVAEEAYDNSSGESLWNQIPYAENAAKAGSLRALEGLIRLFEEMHQGDPQRANLRFEHVFPPLVGRAANSETLRKWFNENKDKLVFNKARGRFELKEQQ